VTERVRLLLGRLLAVVQGAIWFATISGTAFRVGWVFGLLALAAAVAARRLPGRSVLLIIGPTAFVTLTALLSLSRSPFDVTVASISMLGAEALPGLLAGVLIWTARTSSAPQVRRVAQTGTRRIAIRRAPGAAVMLALLSIAPVAASFNLAPPADLIANKRFASPPIDWQPIDIVHALVLAMVAVLVAALVGGIAGGFTWRRSPIWAGIVALATAWAAALGVLPVVAAVVGIHLRTGIVCIFGCEALLREDQPFGGLAAYAEFILGTAALTWPVIGLAAIGIVIMTIMSVRRRSGPTGPATSPSVPITRLRLVVPLGAFAVIHGAGIAALSSSRQTGLIPYVCLSIGVVIWAAWLHRSSAGPLGVSGPPAEDVHEHRDELRLVGVHGEVDIGGLAAPEAEVAHGPPH
jgi:hypothetical protein